LASAQAPAPAPLTWAGSGRSRRSVGSGEPQIVDPEVESAAIADTPTRVLPHTEELDVRELADGFTLAEGAKRTGYEGEFSSQVGPQGADTWSKYWSTMSMWQNSCFAMLPNRLRRTAPWFESGQTGTIRRPTPSFSQVRIVGLARPSTGPGVVAARNVEAV